MNDNNNLKPWQERIMNHDEKVGLLNNLLTKIYELQSKGWTIEEIAEEVNLPEATVRYHLRKDIPPEPDYSVKIEEEKIMDTYEGPSEEELYRMEKLKKNTVYGSAGRPNNLMSTDGELKQWQKDIMEKQNVQKTLLERFRDQNDPVNHPSHYTDGKIEVIDFIEDKKLGFHLGNAVKYIARAGKKDPKKEIEDLKKAIWYINRRIANISGDTDGDPEIINQEIKPLTSFEADLIKWKEGVKND